jgi:hypothetical protein
MIWPILPQPSSPIFIMINRLWAPLVKSCAHEKKFTGELPHSG